MAKFPTHCRVDAAIGGTRYNWVTHDCAVPMRTCLSNCKSTCDMTGQKVRGRAFRGTRAALEFAPSPGSAIGDATRTENHLHSQARAALQHHTGHRLCYMGTAPPHWDGRRGGGWAMHVVCQRSAVAHYEDLM